MIGCTYLERGHQVVVLARWNGRGPRNVLVRRESGEVVVRPFRGLRRAQPGTEDPGQLKEAGDQSASS